MNSSTELQKTLRSLTDDALERMVYLVGSARGGTSLSLHLIGAHPRLLGFQGPSHFVNQLWRYRKIVHQRLLQVIFWANNLVDQERLFASLDDDQSAAANALIHSAFDSREFRALHDLYPLFCALDPSRPQKAEDYLAWFDKGNDANGLATIAKYYPKAKFLFIVRDPRGAISTLSMIRAKRAGSSADLSDVLAESVYWRNLTQRCMRFAAAEPNRALIYSYERLITDPQRVLSEIYSFLDLPALDAEALSNIIDHIGFGSNWDSDDKGLKTQPIFRWKQVLEPEALDIITTICGPTARKLGFDMSPTDRWGKTLRYLRLAKGARAKATLLAKLAYLAIKEPAIRPIDPGSEQGRLLWSPAKAEALEAQASLEPTGA